MYTSFLLTLFLVSILLLSTAPQPTQEPAGKMPEDNNNNYEGRRRKRSGGYAGGRDPLRAVATFVLVFLVLAGVVVLTLWLVYRPHKPKFTVVSAAVYNLNVTAPPFMSTTMQFTVITRNPNKRVSMFYDHLSAFVVYKNQAITPPLMLPPLYHDTKTTVALSPLLGGAPLPVAPEVINGLMMDETYGVVGLRLVLVGRVKYRAGAIRTKHYSLYVKCDMLIGLKKGFVGQVPLLGPPAGCKVDV